MNSVLDETLLRQGPPVFYLSTYTKKIQNPTYQKHFLIWSYQDFGHFKTWSRQIVGIIPSLLRAIISESWPSFSTKQYILPGNTLYDLPKFTAQGESVFFVVTYTYVHVSHLSPLPSSVKITLYWVWIACIFKVLVWQAEISFLD